MTAMDCRTVRDNLELCLLDELPDREAERLRSHLRGCPACQVEMDRAGRMLEALDAALREPAAPADLAEWVIAYVEGSVRRRRLGWTAVAAAACLAVAAALTAGLWPRVPAGPGDGGVVDVPKAAALGVADLVGCSLVPEAGAEFEILGPRRVRQGSGEVFFEVEPAGEPFVVETPAGSATVLGTQFRVRTQAVKGDEAMKGGKFMTLVAVLTGVVQLANVHGAATAEAGETVVAQDDAAPVKQAQKLADRFGSHYKPVKVDVRPAVPAYALPVDAANVDSLKDILDKYRLEDQAHLLKHGFAIYPRFSRENDDFVKFYKEVKDRELPLYVTADSVLHLYHIQFDKILKTAEEKEFIPALAALLESLDAHLVGQGAADVPLSPELQQANRLAQAYLRLAHRLLTDRTDERPLLQALRGAVMKAGNRSYGLTGEHAEAMKCFRDPAPAFRAIQGVPRQGKDAALKLIDAELEAIDASEPKRGLLPAEEEEAIEQELKLIAAHEGFKESPLFVYSEDYSQYVPRGHYTQTPALKRYFKAMMWLGRMTFLVKGGEPYGPGSPYLVSEAEARRQTLAAAMLTEALDKAKLEEGVRALEVWQRIYDVTAFMVGAADDLGYEEYKPALDAAVGPGVMVSQLMAEGKMLALKKELLRLSPPAIYSGTGDIVSFDAKALAGIANEKELDRALASTMGFRLMGQRFVPDSYWMGKLVFPTVGAPTAEHDPKPFTWGMTAAGPRRVFPRGLDVAALLGSRRAAELLKARGDAAYDGYDKAVEKLRQEMADLSETQWNFNLYWSWLHCLKPLLVEFGQGYPTYMQQAAWQDKCLAAALGSWSELRHDTILYAKQSYTMRAGGMPPIPAERPGYVEPVPELYGRLLALSRLTKDRMAAMKCLDEDMTKRLDNTEKLLARLLDISKQELENKVLEAEDYKWIRDFAGTMRMAAVGGRFIGEDADELKTTLVADVHTDGNSRTVLEEATGQLALLVVVNKLPDGKLYAACGPVFTYYEFKQPMAERLTDESWIQMLEGGGGRYELLPDWYRDGLGAGWQSAKGLSLPGPRSLPPGLKAR